LVNASYPFTLILLAPVVATRFAGLILNKKLARNGKRKVQSINAYSPRQLSSLIAAAIIIIVAFFWVKPMGQEFLSSNWNQFIARFSIAGGIEPYKSQVTYVIASFLLVLLFANFVFYKAGTKIGATGRHFRNNTYMSIMGIGGLLIALLVSHYSETITEGGTYYAIKLSYSAALIALIAIVAVSASFLQSLITYYQWKKSSKYLLTSKRTFSLGLLAVTVFLAGGGYVLHGLSQLPPRVFQRAYMGTISQFISEFNAPGSSGIDSHLVAFAAQESKRLNRPIFLITGGITDTLGTVWVNEVSGSWNYQLWESINHVPSALIEGDTKEVADYFDNLNMILITDDATLLMRLQSEVPTLVGCTLDEISIGMCDLQKHGST
jgi:hypothetical protein